MIDIEKYKPINTKEKIDSLIEDIKVVNNLSQIEILVLQNIQSLKIQIYFKERISSIRETLTSQKEREKLNKKKDDSYHLIKKEIPEKNKEKDERKKDFIKSIANRSVSRIAKKLKIYPTSLLIEKIKGSQYLDSKSIGLSTIIKEDVIIELYEFFIKYKYRRRYNKSRIKERRENYKEFRKSFITNAQKRDEDIINGFIGDSLDNIAEYLQITSISLVTRLNNAGFCVNKKNVLTQEAFDVLSTFLIRAYRKKKYILSETTLLKIEDNFYKSRQSLGREGNYRKLIYISTKS